jgi:hypothetical protein
MNPQKSLWKKIEHFIVLAIFFGIIILGLINVFFWEDLGFAKQSSDPGDTSSDCAPDPRYPC